MKPYTLPLMCRLIISCSPLNRGAPNETSAASCALLTACTTCSPLNRGAPNETLLQNDSVKMFQRTCSPLNRGAPNETYNGVIYLLAGIILQSPQPGRSQ